MDVDREVLFYFIIGIVVLAVLFTMSGGFSDIIFGKGLEYTKLFERGALHIIDIGKFRLDCRQDGNKFTYVAVLDDLKYLYEGEEVELDFVILLDFKGELMFGHTMDEGIVHFSSGASNEIKRMAFVLISKLPPDSSEDILHFTMWRASDNTVKKFINDNCPSSEVATDEENKCNLHSLIDDRYGYYLASFDLKTDISGCSEAVCHLLTNDGEFICNDAVGCYWTSPPFWFDSCQPCPDIKKCEDYTNEQCSHCDDDCLIKDVTIGYSIDGRRMSKDECVNTDCFEKSEENCQPPCYYDEYVCRGCPTVSGCEELDRKTCEICGTDCELDRGLCQTKS